MRIAYDYQIFDSQKFGGISRYFFELIRHIAEFDGVETRVFSPFFINCYPLPAFFPVTGVHVPEIPKTAFLRRGLNRLITSRLMQAFSPDLVHETYYTNNTSTPKNVKVIMTIHDMIHEILPESFVTTDDTKRTKADAIRRADHLICVSENTRQDLIQLLGVDPDKTSVVHHGCELLASPSGMRLCVSPYILYVGSRGGYKNFDRLLQAYAVSPSIHREFKLVLFGGGKLTMSEQFRVQELGGGRLQVQHFSGGDEVLADLYASASAFVYPSLYEGFGISPLEAMSVGCPVLCSDRGSMPEVLDDAAEFFDPESVDSIRCSLMRVMFDSSYKMDLIAKGLRQCKKYSWKKSAQKTFAIYRFVSGY